MKHFIKATHAAGMAEYSIVAGLVAVAAIASVLLFGDANRTGLCAADSTLAANALGKDVEPCVSRFNTPPETLAPGPVTPTFINQDQPVLVPSEDTEFLNPVGSPHAIEAITVQGTAIENNANEDIYLDLLCEYLGYDGPHTGVTYIAANAANATFLPDGRMRLTELPGLAWTTDSGAAPYNTSSTDPIIGTLSCTQTVQVPA